MTTNQPDPNQSPASTRTPGGDPRPPWRVEGARPQGAPGRRPAAKRPSVWVLFPVLLALDWILVLASQPTTPARVTVPYSNFVSQVNESNVASGGAQGSAIQRTPTEHREHLDRLSEALLKHETLDEADAYAVAGIVRRSATEQPVAAQA